MGYVALINKFPERFINGTDFLAQNEFVYKDYYDNLQAVSEIHKYINNEAFRNIALGQTYFKLLRLDTVTPKICTK